MDDLVFDSGEPLENEEQLTADALAPFARKTALMVTPDASAMRNHESPATTA